MKNWFRYGGIAVSLVLIASGCGAATPGARISWASS